MAEIAAEISIDNQIKDAQLASTRLDVKLKEAELNTKPRPLRAAFTSSLVAGAIVAGVVALCSTISAAAINLLVADNQTAVDKYKAGVHASSRSFRLS